MAYAALISLDNSIGRHTGRGDWDWSRSAIAPLIEELAPMVKSLKEVLERLDDDEKRIVDRSVMNVLDAKITEAAWKLEDVLDSYILNHSLENVVKQEIDLFLQRAEELRDECTRELEKPRPAAGEEEGVDDDVVVTMDDFVREESRMIGLWDQFEEIRNELLDFEGGNKIVSLVGMAGIGKTRLAKEIYKHPTILQHFDLLVWVRVGVKHETENIFMDILAQIDHKPRNAYRGMKMALLILHMRNVLGDRRCLIVLDDIWSIGVCPYLSLLFKGGNRRRFLVTTRLGEAVKGHSTTIHRIRFLNNEESWDLLWRNVFLGEESFPPELEEAGRKIAENCEGLPLLILAVADILRGLDRTERYWMEVASNRTTTFIDAYERIDEVLRLSYDYMPQRFKGCFLYMGVFPQSSVIPMAKLLRLLSVEDFTESSWIPFSNEYVEELISSSVVIACKHAQCSKFTIKSCKLHSAYWHLCVKEARKNKFFHVLRKLSDASEGLMESQHRLCVQNNILFGIKEAYASMASTLTTRSLLCTGEYHEYPVPICFNLPLLRVLDALAIRFYEFPEEVVKLVWLRYLAFTHNGELPSSIYEFKHLECLIFRPHHNIRSSRVSTYLPLRIWYMRHLTYLRISGSNLPDPGNYRGLWLSTLYVNAHSCTEAVLGKLHWLEKLVIDIELQPDGGEPCSCFKYIRTPALEHLKSLKCVVVNPWLRYSRVVAPPDHLWNLPLSLTKLSLNGLGYSWECMSAIGSLPDLQVLKVRCSAFRGTEWETGAKEFQSLEFLVLEDIDLKHWRIDKKTCFPKLEQLVIEHCYKLKEIPALPAMKRIELVDCSPSAVASAEEQRSSSLNVVIDSSWSRSR